ncbi:MAG: hypothetical protein HY376_04110 [Candidatus Blackburnbacteria bacterium]|nr:hypothetical protein [Candidatus Blackburnbacteria bacterium]
MPEIAQSPEFRQSQTGSFVIQLERSLRAREVDTQDPTKVRETLDDKDFWYGDRGFWTKLSSKYSPPEKIQELTCSTLLGESQQLGTTHEDVKSLRRMLNISGENQTLDDLRTATGGISGGKERTVEPINLFQAQPAEAEERPPRHGDPDEAIAYKTYRETWDPKLANRVDYWFDNERAKLMARDKRPAPERQEAKPPLRWLLDEINASLKERGVDSNDRTQIEAQIRNEEFWLGTPSSFWNKLSEGSGMAPEEYQEKKCQEVLNDVRTNRDGHQDRAGLRRLFALPHDYRFDLYDLIDVTNGFITHSQLVEQEASRGQAQEAEAAHAGLITPETNLQREAAPIQELIRQGDEDDGALPQRWQRVRGTLATLDGAAATAQEVVTAEPEAVSMEGENLTNRLRDSLLRAQEAHSQATNGNGVEKKARERQRKEEQARRAQELIRKYKGE